MKSKDMILISLCSAIIVICSWITIPIFAVPFTLQTFAVFLITFILGGKKALISIFIYIVLGAIGLPVFSGFKGGIGVLLGPTGGYIWGFTVQALIYLVLTCKISDSDIGQYIGSLIGLIACYLCGTLWFVYVYTVSSGSISFMAALGLCVVPFIIPDIGKLILAKIVASRVKKSIT